ncbi:oligosaccharide flippase family protein [Vagococcus fluvialis]|uniref:oligosaccharide flippase family protein n=1 Tax=Vagococcus fluvialis TaxID=2738 RepID=UPI003D107A52
MKKYKHIIQNIYYTLSSNLLSFFVSTIITLLLPKLLGVADYGYYQLYLFYTSYVGLLHFGWCDGIYLRYSGKKYDDLNKELFRGQYLSLFLMEIILSLLILISLYFSNISDYNKLLVLYGTIFNIILQNMRTFSLFVLQATNRMKAYSRIIIFDRLIFVSISIVLIFFRLDSFWIYMCIDIFAKIISLIVSVYKIDDIIVDPIKIKWSFYESKENIKTGINLTLANIASILIIGIVRLGIQDNWDVETFGKVSLSLSVSNMLMLFINAISLAIFPLIKRQTEESYKKSYKMIRVILMPTALILLMMYYPVKIFLLHWLPDYEESLNYMGIIFPMIVFESKVSLLTNTFLKAMRQEKAILVINILSLGVSVVLTGIMVYVLNNLFMTMIAIVFILGFRSIISELVLSKILDVFVIKDILLELIVISSFIFLNQNYSINSSMIIYTAIILIYLYFKKSELIQLIKAIKS